MPGPYVSLPPSTPGIHPFPSAITSGGGTL